MTDSFQTRMTEYLGPIETFLAGQFTEDLPQKQLLEAMRYSLLAGGKRIRPVLTLGLAFGDSVWVRTGDDSHLQSHP